jgi:transaldolase
MALYLDSADVQEARRAAGLGFIAGVTTNPVLIARTGLPAEQVVANLCAVLSGTIFYQVTSPPGPDLEAEVARIRAISDQVAVKIPCTLDYLKVVHDLSQHSLVCAVTGVFSTAQAYIAAEAGARYIIPYVNRATRLFGDGPVLVAEMAAVLQSRAWSAAGEGACEILAASIKGAVEAVHTLLAGAHHVSLPWAVLSALAEHRLTDLAMEEFARASG